MLSAKTINPAVIQLHQGQPHIRTEIVILSPITGEIDLRDDLRLRIDLVQKIMAAVNLNVEDVIREQFSADIESICTTVRNL